MRTFAIAFTGAIVGTIFTSILVLAWTGPTSAPPSGNVAAPVNVGSVDQIKDGGLGLNALAVFGNSILSGPSVTYLNFGASAGESGYGLRDNNGTMEFKNSGGTWSGFLPNTNVESITFADGTMQTTAASPATIDAGTLCGLAIASGTSNCPQASYSSIARCAEQSITSSCPSGYTQRTVETARIPNQTGNLTASTRYCLRTCSKN